MRYIGPGQVMKNPLLRIPMSRPSLGDTELAAVEEVMRSGWLGEGPKTREFEEALAAYTGAPEVVAVNTGTSALHLALLALGIGPGDEVILPSFTYVSDPMAVSLTGAKPVFADIDPHTLNLDPAHVSSLVTARTRAIMPTDYAGLPADVPALRRALGDDIPILRDAAHSMGSRIDSRPVGVWCGETATVFSFDPIKNLTCGEGGAVLANDAEVARRLRSLRSLGYVPGSRIISGGRTIKGKSVLGLGYRCHMSSINAAIGLAQFPRLAGMVARKQAIARRYDAGLTVLPGLQTFSRNYDEVVPFIYPVRVGRGLRDGLVESFAARGIHAELRYSPCHWEPCFQSENAVLPETERVARELICLPVYADLSDEEVDEVVEVVGGHLRCKARQPA